MPLSSEWFIWIGVVVCEYTERIYHIQSQNWIESDSTKLYVSEIKIKWCAAFKILRKILKVYYLWLIYYVEGWRFCCC